MRHALLDSLPRHPRDKDDSAAKGEADALLYHEGEALMAIYSPGEEAISQAALPLYITRPTQVRRSRFLLGASYAYGTGISC